VHHKLFCQRRVMNTANAGEIGLQKKQRFLPTCRREIADRIQSAVDRVVLLVLRSPGISQPVFFLRRDGQNPAYLFVFQVKIRQPLQGLRQFQADIVHITELFRHRQQRTQHDANRFFDTITFVADSICHRIGPQPF